MNRVSTLQAFDTSLAQLQKRQVEMSEMQNQLTTGKRVNRASDDPTAAARAERALASSARVDADQRGVDASKSFMSLTESSLGDANDLLQRARELVVQAGNAGLGDSERKNLATELQGIRSQLLTIANRSDGANGYLFGGQGSAQAPFIDAPGAVQFRGTGGEAKIAGTEGLPIAMDGGATWLSARTGNGVFETKVTTSTGSATIDVGSVVNPSALTGSTYDIQFTNTAGVVTYSVLKDGAATAMTNVPYQAGTAMQIDGMAVTVSGAPATGDAFKIVPSSSTLSVFDTLDKTVSDLSTPNKRGPQITQDSIMNLRNLDQVMGRLTTARSDAGVTLNRIDGVTDRLGEQKISAETEKSNAQDLDMVQAISDFQNKQSGYDAALKSYSMVQRLSLFQYLNG
ncbi:flagellar hook-associated protein FlgL [Piscinibacter terrae]|uniref:Flagellar hook-associated protein 3 n=1 Tax=Piscinibacter terrae TaxID=2496871 RepID=A0A3N7HTH8_9BURK|nr:flagellar hook-associated protein FlgL [Albitalea terrae]RQP25083.1 flagellar hook-associated protein 3 [Albitalea terrae]